MVAGAHPRSSRPSGWRIRTKHPEDQEDYCYRNISLLWPLAFEDEHRSREIRLQLHGRVVANHDKVFCWAKNMELREIITNSIVLCSIDAEERV